MKTFLLLAAGQGILLSTGLISSVVFKKWSNLFLGLITLVFSIEILNVWAMYINYHNHAHPIAFWTLSTYLIIPPALYFFGKFNTQPQFRVRPKDILFFLPALIEFIVELVAFYSNLYRGTSYEPHQIPLWYFFTEVLPLLALITVLTIAIRDIYQLYHKYQAFLKAKQRGHLIKLCVFFGVFVLITLLWFAEAFIYLPVFGITLLLLSICIFILGYIAYFNPEFFNLPSYLTRPNSQAYEHIDAEAEEAQKIHQTFLDEQLYLRARLTLKEAATELKMPQRQLSELINKYQGVDFRTYVNTLRINEVMRQVQAGALQEKTILGVALEAGFNSKSSFNKTFKDLKGTSPSRFFDKNPPKTS